VARIVIREERCKGCGYCIDVCVKGNLYLDQTKQNCNGYSPVAFNPDKDCNGCALCAECCPDVAIEVYR
jgi:2-oxoglutarate ferredoxin oxidoreductase subunit delta